MDKWIGKVALVTGASSDIGKAIVDKLVRSGMKVVACARSEEKLLKHSFELSKLRKGEILSVTCDLREESHIIALFKYIKDKFGTLQVCINNAGVMATGTSLITGKTEDWREMIDLNMVALCILTGESYNLMKSSGVDDGHIINISSVSGHKDIGPPMSSATKFAVTAFNEGFRQELRAKKSNIRTTTISPSIVQPTCLTRCSEEGTETFETEICFPPNNVANAITFALTAPLYMDVKEIFIRRTFHD